MKNLLIANLKAKMEAEKTAAEEERLNNLPEASLQDDMKAVSKHRLNVVEVEDIIKDYSEDVYDEDDHEEDDDYYDDDNGDEEDY